MRKLLVSVLVLGLGITACSAKEEGSGDQTEIETATGADWADGEKVCGPLRAIDEHIDGEIMNTDEIAKLIQQAIENLEGVNNKSVEDSIMALGDVEVQNSTEWFGLMGAARGACASWLAPAGTSQETPVNSQDPAEGSNPAQNQSPAAGLSAWRETCGVVLTIGKEVRDGAVDVDSVPGRLRELAPSLDGVSNPAAKETLESLVKAAEAEQLDESLFLDAIAVCQTWVEEQQNG
jgi:hypothetical protein